MFLLHCDEWDRVVALPRHKFVTGATLLQLDGIEYDKLNIFMFISATVTQVSTPTLPLGTIGSVASLLVAFLKPFPPFPCPIG
jgi:hypothetical protein